MCTTFETAQPVAAKKNASKFHKINIARTGLPVSNAIYYAFVSATTAHKHK
jgi:hypothetical protein